MIATHPSPKANNIVVFVYKLMLLGLEDLESVLSFILLRNQIDNSSGITRKINAIIKYSW